MTLAARQPWPAREGRQLLLRALGCCCNQVRSVICVYSVERIHTRRQQCPYHRASASTPRGSTRADAGASSAAVSNIIGQTPQHSEGRPTWRRPHRQQQQTPQRDGGRYPRGGATLFRLTLLFTGMAIARGTKRTSYLLQAMGHPGLHMGHEGKPQVWHRRTMLSCMFLMSLESHRRQ